MNQKPEICDPSEKKVQVILTDAFQLGYVLEKLLGFTGAADITVSTFSTGEEFLRKLIALRRKGLIRTARLFTDFKAAEKTAKINAMLRRTYDFGASQPVLEHRGALLNIGDSTLTYKDEKIQLSKNEFRILTILLKSKGKVPI